MNHYADKDILPLDNARGKTPVKMAILIREARDGLLHDWKISHV